MAHKVLQLRHDTAANWTSANPTLAAGELGFETNTGKFKLGDGSTAWASLAYAATLPGDFTELAQDAVGAMIADTSTIDLTYTDATPELKADVKISASPGDVTITAEADGLKTAISAIDCGGAT
jgi:hypothetical protein